LNIGINLKYLLHYILMDKLKVGAGFGVMLFKEGKILLGRRHADPEKADSELNGEGTWTMPGGKLHFGESFEEGAAREVREETGIKIRNAKVISLTNEIVETAHFVTVGLFCDQFSGDPQILEPDEIVEWRWFDLDYLPTPMFKASQGFINNYKEKIFYKKEKLKLGTYKHYRRGLYQLIGEAKDSEDLKDLVVYQALYDSEIGKKVMWVRPKEEFCGFVEVDGVRKKRFTFIDNS